MRPVRHQLGHRHFQAFRKLLNGFDGHVPFATFDAADVGAVKPRKIGQPFLRNLVSSANLPKPMPEPFSDDAHSDALLGLLGVSTHLTRSLLPRTPKVYRL